MKHINMVQQFYLILFIVIVQKIYSMDLICLMAQLVVFFMTINVVIIPYGIVDVLIICSKFCLLRETFFFVNFSFKLLYIICYYSLFTIELVRDLGFSMINFLINVLYTYRISYRRVRADSLTRKRHRMLAFF